MTSLHATGVTIRLLVVAAVLTGMLGLASPASASANIVVSRFDDVVATDGFCSLREAVTATNTDTTVDTCVDTSTSGTDTINLPAGTYTLAGAHSDDANVSGDLDFTDTDATVVTSQASADVTFIQNGTASANASATPPVPANGIDRVIHALSGTNVTLRKVTIRNGTETQGAGGGGILAAGFVTLDVAAVVGNSSTAAGGGVATLSSGGLGMGQSEISGNVGSVGGGVRLNGLFGAISSTISGNAAHGAGGGVNANQGIATFAGVTIAANRSDADNSGDGSGGGIWNNAAAHVMGTVMGDNTSGPSGISPDCAGSAYTSYGANVIENAFGCTGFTQTGDIAGVDPQLRPLAFYPNVATRTHIPAPTSPVVDRWPTSSCQSATPPPGWPGAPIWIPVAEDQRGIDRPKRAACDSGAVELQTYTLTVTVAGPGSGTVTSAPAGISCPSDCSESTYLEGSLVTLSATPTSGTFAGWGGACSGTGPCTVVMDADGKTVSARFEAPTAKNVSLTAKPKKVRKGKKVTLTAVVSPCGGHEGDTVELLRKGTRIASTASSASCTAVFKVKMKKKATFQAVSPAQDVDHLAGTSNTVAVKVKRPPR